MRTYYDRPILKEPVWKWYVPAYFFTGGLAAGTSLLAAGARLTGDERTARRCLLASLGATAVSTVFLIEDLGRPARFLNMLRVAKPTSPMSVGSWVLAAFGTATAAAVVTGSRAAHAVSATLAPVLATYTAVLIADTAIPAWHEARTELPFVFAGGALASSGALATLVAPHPAARRLAVAGSVLELAASRRMKSRLGPLADPYHGGAAGGLSKLAEATTAAGALLLTVRRWRAPAVLILAGAAAERFAIFHAGVASARDPRQTLVAQREATAAEVRPW
ncbi:MAG: NrfD/PsrC family molybdoenzyme membrane anchor subunit [Acidimicrobiales bacterium]